MVVSFTPDILPIGKYFTIMSIYQVDSQNHWKTFDQPMRNIYFEIFEDDSTGIRWAHEYMGHVRMGKLNLDFQK